MAFTVLYDACVLYPAPLRDLLLRVAITGLVRAKWTDAILDECFEAISKQRPDANPDALARTRVLMVQAVPDCLVTGFEPLVEGLSLPDEDDRHVLAAAIRSGAQAIVTFNLKDFPKDTLQPLGIEAIDPDDYVSDLIDLAGQSDGDPPRTGRRLEEPAQDRARDSRHSQGTGASTIRRTIAGAPRMSLETVRDIP